MKTSTAYNHLKRLQSVVGDILSSARYGAMSHADIMAEMQRRIYNDPAYRKCPGWVQSAVSHRYLDGTQRLYQPDIYAAELDRREAAIRAGQEVPELPYVCWFLHWTDEAGTVHYADNWDALPEAAREMFRVPGFDGKATDPVGSAHRWNHRRDRAF